MVFPGGISLLSENENAPLSPEQVEHAKFKSSQLDSELGWDTYHDPSGDENGKESEEQLFSDLNLGKSVENEKESGNSALIAPRRAWEQ